MDDLESSPHVGRRLPCCHIFEQDAESRAEDMRRDEEEC